MSQRSGPERSDVEPSVDGGEAAAGVDMVAVLLVDLAERTGRLDSLLSELSRPDQLGGLVSRLHRADPTGALAALLVELVHRTDEIDDLMADLAAQSVPDEALVAGLKECTDQVEALVADLERTVTQSSDEPR